MKWSLFSLFILLVILFVLLGWVAGTRSGLDFAWSLIQPRLPETMAVADIEGRLTGPLTITGLQVDNESMHAAVDRIHLEWQVADLLTGTVHVEKLSVSGVDYKAKKTAESQPPPEEKGEPFTLPDAIKLPVQVRVDKVAVDDVSVTTSPDAKPFVLSRVRLKNARLTGDKWRVGSLTASGPLFDVSARAVIKPHGRYAMNGSLQAKLRLPDQAPIHTQVEIHGDLERLIVEQKVAAPYNMALNATLTDIALDAIAGIGIDATLKLQDLQLARIRPDLSGIAPITAELHISGTPQKLTLKQTVAAPYNLKLAATLTDLLRTPNIDANVSLNGMKPAAIKSSLPKMTLNTQLQVAGTPQQLTISLDTRADSKKYGRVSALARVRYTPETVTIKRLLVQRPDSPMRLKAHGTVALAKGNAMDLTLQWQQLRWPLEGQAAYQSRRGDFRITGTLDDYQVKGQLGWQIADQGKGRMQLAGTGSLESFHLAKLHISGAPGEITATADATWSPALDVRAHVEGQHINPGAIVPKVPGDFRLEADLTASQHDGVITAHVKQLEAEGSLRGQPLHLDAKLAYLGDHVKLSNLDLNYAGATARARGRLGWTPDAALDLRWSVDAEDLSSMWPGLAGMLKTQGRVSGTVSAPSAEATLTARNIKYNKYRVGSVDLDAEVDWSGNTPSRVTLNVADVVAAGQQVHSLEMQLTGTPAKHALELNLDSSSAQLKLALNAGLDKQSMAWQFTLTSLRAAYGPLDAWSLASPASGVVSADTQRIANACLTSGDARLCLDGEHTTKGASANIKLNDLAFAYLEPYLPENFRFTGSMSASVAAELPAEGVPDVKVHVKTTAGQISTRQNDGDRVKVLAFEPANVDVTLADRRLDAVIALPLVDNGAITANVAVAAGDAPLTARPLKGHVKIDVARLDFVTRLVSEVAAIKGQIGGNMRISGTLSAPRILGNIALEAQRIVLLTPGLELTNVRLAADGHGDSIDISLDAHSGGGQLNVDGQIELAATGPTIELAIKGERFKAANTPMVRAWISPDLNVSVTPQAVHVTGRLKVPKARITPRDLPAAGAVTAADDAVIVTDKKTQPAEAVARSILADILVVLGDVRIKGFGLKTGIEGQLRVKQAPGEPVTAAGKLNLVDGSYRAYGQNLDIVSGTILFSGGPISNVGIDLRAARYPAEDITVGVHVRGSVQSPKVTLYSEPPMSQAETLSWLLLGRPLKDSTGGQSNLVAKAALALGSGRANKVLDNIGDAIGVDKIGIGSAAGHGASEAAFMLGKYLTPKLYLSYGIGIFSSIATMTLSYTLNSHWKLETSTSGVATGGDIIFTFER